MEKPTYHANVFELKKSKPLDVYSYGARITPAVPKPVFVYRILGKIARNLTKQLATAAISDQGKIKILGIEIPQNLLLHSIDIEEFGTFNVELLQEGLREVGYADSPIEYTRLVNRIVDLSLAYLSDDFFKYSDVSPWIIERGEGYFDDAFRATVGIEDGRRYYRDLREFGGVPCLLLNREIELRSWKNLLNELKALAAWWSKVRGKPIDFYNPPDDFKKYVNFSISGKSADVIAYSSRSIRIKEVTWECRAKDPLLEGGKSPIQYHEEFGIKNLDENQPLVKWVFVAEDGKILERFHIPELLVVGHTFDDLSARILPSQISQVFDIVHPNCGDQQRKIFDVIKKIDSVLRGSLASVYPSILEFSVIPKEITQHTILPSKIELTFGNRDLSLEPPYGLNFYQKYGRTLKFAKPITGEVRTLVMGDSSHRKFVEQLQNEFEVRNDCKMNVELLQVDPHQIKPSQADLLITITNENSIIEYCKKTLQNKHGLIHQNVRPEHANEDSIPQIAMQLTLKLGGFPWFLKAPQSGYHLLTIYCYRNPTGLRSYFFMLMTPNGEVLIQSRAFDSDKILSFLRHVHQEAKKYERLIVITNFDDQAVYEYVAKDMEQDVAKFIVLRVSDDHLRMFKTFKPTPAPARRRRVVADVYPVEAYECAPQGVIAKASRDEFYVLTTISTKVRTYYRGCPTPLKVKVIQAKGEFDIDSVLRHILSLSLAAGTSGNGTRDPAPLYYLQKYAAYVIEYGEPENEQMLRRLFYV